MATALAERTIGDVEVKKSTDSHLGDGYVKMAQELALPGLVAERVEHRVLPVVKEGEPLPRLIFAHDRTQFSIGGTNARDDNRYWFHVLLVSASTRSLDATSPSARQLKRWFQMLGRGFNSKRPAFTIPGVCYAGTMKIEEADPRIAAQWVQQRDAMLLRLSVVCREGRS